MIDSILEVLKGFVTMLFDVFGYWGIVIAMAIESACIPLPSEIIMPVAGTLVADGKINFWLAGLAGAFGNLLGSWIAYYAGMYGGRPFLEKYGRYMLVTRRDLDLADRWFAKYGDITIFVTRLMPVVRTFISFPAGVTRMNILKFSLYTFGGALPWALGLTYMGMILMDNWDQVKSVWHGLDALILGAIAVLLYLYVRRHVRELKREKNERLAGDESISSSVPSADPED